MLLVLVFGFGAIGSAMTNSLSLFFVKHVMLVGELYPVYLAPYFVCQMAAIPLWFKLSRRIGKHKATMWAIGWYALWSSFIPLVMVAPSEWFTLFDVTGVWIPPAATEAVGGAYLEGVEAGKLPVLPCRDVPQGLRHRRLVGAPVRDVR